MSFLTFLFLNFQSIQDYTDLNLRLHFDNSDVPMYLETGIPRRKREREIETQIVVIRSRSHFRVILIFLMSHTLQIDFTFSFKISDELKIISIEDYRNPNLHAQFGQFRYNYLETHRK